MRSSTAYGMCLRSTMDMDSGSAKCVAAYARSSGKGAATRKSLGALSAWSSVTTCSPAAMRTRPTSPYERRTTRGKDCSEQARASLRRVCWGSCVATTMVNSWRKLGSDSRSEVMLSHTKEPRTCSLSSWSRAVTHSARGRPRCASSTKKLLPRSRVVTTASSTTVKEPIPGKTRFFKVSVPVALPLTRQSLHLSRASCPCSPHIRN
mmetsp:Transcript_7775/g.21260  ORF Transcript_7775/g.21260 Transcript_7775/m.21260 type:complete len:207 (+) Transcript_7775:1191-1811(+)